MKQPALLLSFIFSLAALHGFAQRPDTIFLSPGDAEKIFLQNNFSLLAAQYNVNASQALIKQARLRDNPTLLTDQTLYDGRFFNHGKTAPAQPGGEVYIQVQQLIRTAGKISKLAAMAGTNAKISELQLDLLLRNLRYSLRNDLFQSYQLASVIALFEQELTQVSKLLQGMQAQLNAGNISRKDFLRIQALQFSLLQEETEYRTNLADVQSELHLLLQTKNDSFIQPAALPETKPILPSFDSLLVLARQNNPEYLLEKTNLLAQEQNLRYQQAIRVPDLTAGIEYDKANSYVPNFYGLTLSLPLPLFNRNQGNIAAAGFTVKQEQSLVSRQEQKLGTDLQNAMTKLKLITGLAQAVDPELNKKYGALLQAAITAYQQKQLGLLEFIDLFEAYKDTQIKFLQQGYLLQKAKEDLNLVTGKDVL
jgi:cobalt-zinc-cadmium efflux system outer membrane protein